MNVLKMGKVPPDPWLMWARKTCGNCSTVFEFQKKELHSGGRPGDSPEYYIECPLCRYSISVDTFEFFPRNGTDDTGREPEGGRNE